MGDAIFSFWWRIGDRTVVHNRFRRGATAASKNGKAEEATARGMTGRVEIEFAAVATHAGATHLTGDRAGEHVQQ